MRPAGLEPAAYGFEVRRSIHLSYGRLKPAWFVSGLCDLTTFYKLY
jgi:hypothetical protein